MLALATVTTAGLLLLAVASKVVMDDVPTDHAPELLRQAIHWRDVSVQDTDPVVRLQHTAMASALVQASRALARDSDLERAVGIDVPRLGRSLETRMQQARAQLQAKASP